MVIYDGELEHFGIKGMKWGEDKKKKKYEQEKKDREAAREYQNARYSPPKSFQPKLTKTSNGYRDEFGNVVIARTESEARRKLWTQAFDKSKKAADDAARFYQSNQRLSDIPEDLIKKGKAFISKLFKS